MRTPYSLSSQGSTASRSILSCDIIYQLYSSLPSLHHIMYSVLEPLVKHFPCAVFSFAKHLSLLSINTKREKSSDQSTNSLRPCTSMASNWHVSGRRRDRSLYARLHRLDSQHFEYELKSKLTLHCCCLLISNPETRKSGRFAYAMSHKSEPCGTHDVESMTFTWAYSE